MNVYEQCPVVENGRFLLRPVVEQDCEDLVRVYSDKAAVPLFNSDNCHGDDFYYRTPARMLQGIRMWLQSYAQGQFVRWSIVDKCAGCAIGTVELFCREAERREIVLRLDLRSDYEREEPIAAILSMLFPQVYVWFACERLITKAIPMADSRIRVLKKMGFVPRVDPIVGHDGTAYGDYWQCTA